MTRLSKKELNKLLSDLIKNLETSFKNNFTGVILFGSYAKGSATKKSDLDVLLTFKKLPKSRIKRLDLIEETINELESIYSISINPILKEESKLKITYLFADITKYAKIYLDKNNKIHDLFELINSNYEKGLIKQFSTKDSYMLWMSDMITS